MFRLKTSMQRFASLPAIIAALGLGFASLAMTGCEDKGPAEEVGEAIDDAGEDVKEAVEEATEDLDDK